MYKFSYRRLIATVYDKHENRVKRRRGSNVDRFCEVEDSSLDRSVRFPDNDGDDLYEFLVRSNVAFMTYLNTLGSDEWELVTYSSSGHSDQVYEGYSIRSGFHPSGMYLLKRRQEL